MSQVPDKIFEKYENDTRYNMRFGDFEHQAADQYSIRNPFGFYFEAEEMKYLVKLLNHEKIVLPGKSILDVGCHHGYHLGRLASLKGSCDEMHGIDIIESYINTARAINPGMEFSCCRSLEDWPEGRFGDYLLVMNFKRLPRWGYKVLGFCSRLLRTVLPGLARRIDDACALSLERNLDDEGIKEQFWDYELVKSYSFIFFFGRYLYLKFNTPIPVIKFLDWVFPVRKYHWALMERK